MTFLEFVQSALEQLKVRIRSHARLYSIVVIIALSTMEIGLVVNAGWSGDFWEHCAVLKELSREPIHPTHPIISSSLPHAFFSPYMVTLGFIGHFTAASPLTILAIMAVFNLFLWLGGLFLLIKIFTSENTWNIYFYLLLFQLFLWGPLAWTWSSFFHINALHYVLPYPSTFSAALTFVSGYFFSRIFTTQKGLVLFLIPVVLFNSIILLTHPTTFLFTAALIAIIAYRQLKTRNLLAVIVVASAGLTVPLAAASFWKYYPFWNLYLSASSDSAFHLSSRPLYGISLLSILPALTTLLLIRKNEFNGNKGIILLIFILLFVYLYGLVSQHYGYGRVISFMVLSSHLLVAIRLSNARILTKQESVITLLLLILTFPHLFNCLKTMKNNTPFFGDKTYANHRFLQDYLDYDDIVMTDMNSLRPVPSFGGRVTASMFPPYWITDNKARLNDISVFFTDTASTHTRKEILIKNNVDFILLNKRFSHLEKDLYRSISLGNDAKVYENDSFILLKVKDKN